MPIGRRTLNCSSRGADVEVGSRLICHRHRKRTRCLIVLVVGRRDGNRTLTKGKDATRRLAVGKGDVIVAVIRRDRRVISQIVDYSSTCRGHRSNLRSTDRVGCYIARTVGKHWTCGVHHRNAEINRAGVRIRSVTVRGVNSVVDARGRNHRCPDREPRICGNRCAGGTQGTGIFERVSYRHIAVTLKRAIDCGCLPGDHSIHRS